MDGLLDVKYKNTVALLNQLSFFAICDRWFCPHEKLTCIYSLLFYNVAIYLLSYAKKVFNSQEYSPVIFVSEYTNIRHLAMTTTEIDTGLALILKVMFWVILVLVMLLFSLLEGLQPFNPTWGYIIVTCIYFVLTENSSQQKITSALPWFNFETFERLEVFWAPVLFSSASTAISIFFIVLVLLLSDSSVIFIINPCIHHINFGLRQMYNHWTVLQIGKACLNRYRVATREELNMLDDVCAICLKSMTYALVTPCNHMFHADCLLKCLIKFANCPMCRQEL